MFILKFSQSLKKRLKKNLFLNLTKKMKLGKKRNILLYAVFLLTSTIAYLSYKHAANQIRSQIKQNTSLTELPDKLTEILANKMRKSPLIFIGGYARSGTTLMRAILDVHPSVSCGPETKIIPAVLKYIKDFKSRQSEMKAFKEAGFKNDTLDSALSLFVYFIMENHIRKSERLCAKDPDVLKYMEFLHKQFPEAKFVYMVRDVAYSMVKKLETEVTFQNFLSYFITWNNYNSVVYEQCVKIGKEHCMMVKYEDLVIKSKQTVMSVAQFLDLTWSEDFLSHEKYVGSKIAVSESEWSTDQIKNPIYTKSVDGWKGKIEGYDRFRVKLVDRMLETFGYVF